MAREGGRAATRRGAATVAGGLAVLAAAGQAAAHAGGGAYILLLPSHLYVLGGALAVAASFVLVALVPWRVRDRLAAARVTIRLPDACGAGAVVSLGSLALVATLVIAGLAGSRDPLANPLPLAVWTLWWVGLASLQAVAGDVWAVANPWTGLHRALTARGPLRRWRAAAPRVYPARAAHWPALAFFLGFAWLELIHPAPADPAVLAGAVAGYVLVHAGAVLAFGPAWLRQAEPFTVLFHLVSRLAPIGWPAPGAPRRLTLTVPGARLLDGDAPHASAGALVLLVLGTVSFDGLSRTFAWLGALGENPLQHPGRSALMLPNTLGLVGLWAVLALAFAAALALGRTLAGGTAPLARLAGPLALALVPVAAGYHLAHYLPAALVDVQHALRAASDPFARGWNLLGTRDRPVIASFLTDPARVYAIWHTQVAVIVAAHVAGVVVADAWSRALAGDARRGVRAGLPLLALMIGYTLLGLWLLSAPAAG